MSGLVFRKLAVAKAGIAQLCSGIAPTARLILASEVDAVQPLPNLLMGHKQAGRDLQVLRS